MRSRYLEPPLVNSYWIIPGVLLAGEYPRTKEMDSSLARLRAMVAAGITRFIDLTTQYDRLEPYEGLLAEVSGGRAERLPFPIRDMGIPDDPGLMVAILDAIDRELRTGTVIGCWLQRHSGDQDGRIRLDGYGPMGLAELWKTCPKSAKHPRSPETEEQREYIRSWRECVLPGHPL